MNEEQILEAWQARNGRSEEECVIGFARVIEKAAFERAAAAVHDVPREGREWVASSLWDNIARDSAARIRALAKAEGNQ